MIFRLLTPSHQLFTAEARVGPQHDLHLGPALAQLRHDALHLVQSAFGRVLIGGTEPRAQQLIVGENVQRQVAVFVVVAVEETLRLMAVERDVGRIQIQHHLLRRSAVRLDVEVGEQRSMAADE